MCTKHSACRAKNFSINTIQPQSCVSQPMAAIQAASLESSASCCDSSGCASDASSLDEEPERRRPSQYITSQSWLISGMDCPSCAKKVETAVNKVAGISESKVLFATEKLVVKYVDQSVAEQVIAAVKKVGFTLKSAEATSNKTIEASGWFSHVKDNLHVISVAIAVMVAAILSYFSPVASQWLFTVTCLVGLYPIARKAIQLALSGTPFAIEMLMSVAALGALYLGDTAEAAMVLLLFLIGERLEAFAASRARSGVQSLMQLVPENAVKIVDGERIEVPAGALDIGDVIEVSPGGRLPADGELISSSASFDESALTGESIPVERYQNESVMAGGVVVDKVVRFKVTSKQGENAIDRILHLIEQAESRKAPLERFIDKFSSWYTPAMMLLTVVVVVVPPLLFGQDWDTWIYRGLAMLLIACPCALVISTPAAITSGLATAARRGALIKGGAALEQLGRVQTIAFDKTGTLTKGTPEVTDIQPVAGMSEESLLTIVGSIEVGSSHPLAVALVNKAKKNNLLLPEADDKQALIGSGVTGVINDQRYSVLAPSKLTAHLDEALSEKIQRWESEGKTVVVALKGDEEVMGIIACQDTLREDAQQAIRMLKNLGIDSVMLTGDNPLSAAAISKRIGIDFQAGLLPQDKVHYVEQLAQSRQVAMVGDGINDAPAMKAASIGIAMGSGTDVALETADSAITHSRLVELAGMIELSRATLANIKQNVTLALGLKAVFLVTSVLGITGLWAAIMADSGATALVTLNALRLLKFKSE
ncbi:zinc/cadmium/mercury/lead-transporting ATPase [Vibrio profundum]|uniref:zinc/cadmium/mercury/lead-transporting ATPase n=1 Tax=Vibrio profundum TaxID=2910247 RepID=UPI003D0EB362